MTAYRHTSDEAVMTMLDCLCQFPLPCPREPNIPYHLSRRGLQRWCEHLAAA